MKEEINTGQGDQMINRDSSQGQHRVDTQKIDDLLDGENTLPLCGKRDGRQG